MHVIATTAGQGKTTQLVDLVKNKNCTRLIVTTESARHIAEKFNSSRYGATETMLPFATRIKMTIADFGTVGIIEVAEPNDVSKVVDWMKSVDIKPEVVALDVNYVMSRTEWLNLAMKLEADNIEVYGTQQVVQPKPKVKPIEEFELRQLFEDAFRGQRAGTLNTVAFGSGKSFF
ncbi:MAG: hypothetical protein ACRCWQ_10875 [Bacilli bacterium]